MATAGTLIKAQDTAAPAKAPTRIAQLAAADIAAAEARAKVLHPEPVAAQEAFTTPAQGHGALVGPEVGAAAETAVGGLDDIDMEGAPALRPIKTLRAHERAKVLGECMALAQRFNGREVDSTGALADLDPAMLDLFGEVDLFMEKYVVDREAYVAWSTEPEGMDCFLRVVALFGRFTERLGG